MSGMAVSVVDTSVSPAAAATKAVTLYPDRQAVVSVTPTGIDNRELATSLIGARSCVEADEEVDSHLNLHQVCNKLKISRAHKYSSQSNI